MAEQTVIPPDQDDVLEELKNEIFAYINCIQIARVESYDKDEQKIEAQIMVKRVKEGGEIIAYPLCVDVPVIVLQGNGGYIEFPIVKGDQCLLLFNDRDIDNWWTANNETEPPTKRKHNLSDAFALVGINPKVKVLTLDGTNVNLWGPTGTDRIQIKPDGKMEIGSSGKAAARIDDTTISDTTTDTSFWSFFAAFFGVVTGAPIPEPGNGAPSAFQAALAAAITGAGGTPTKQDGKINSGSGEVTIK